MAEDDTGDARRPSDAIAEAAVAEKRLLRAEEDAERRLAKATTQRDRAQKKLTRAQERFDVQSESVREAEEALRAHQAARAAGPEYPELRPLKAAVSEKRATPPSDAPARPRRRSPAKATPAKAKSDNAAGS